jgi:hypothetical protein
METAIAAEVALRSPLKAAFLAVQSGMLQPMEPVVPLFRIGPTLCIPVPSPETTHGAKSK